MNNKLLYKVRVKGRVQGVGFRWSAAREAARLGITGYVRNDEDGSVYIEAEGTEDRLNAFLEWCRKGPGIGFVQSADFTIHPPVNHSDFKIDH